MGGIEPSAKANNKPKAVLSKEDAAIISYRDSQRWLDAYKLPKGNTLPKRRESLLRLFVGKPDGFKLVLF